MRIATLPSSPKPLSRIVLGTDTVGAIFPWSDTAEMRRFLDAILDLGCTAIDTAAVYLLGGSERLVGEWISSRKLRDRIFLITKGAAPVLPFTASRFDVRAISADLHASLRRLRTDYVDLYLLHRDDPSRPFEDVLALLARFHREGKCAAYGVSNWTLPRIQAAMRFLEAENLPPLAASSPHFSLVDWTHLFLPGCISIASSAGDAARKFHEKTQLPVLAWSPLGRGFFGRRAAQSTRPPWHSPWQMWLHHTYASEANFARRRRAHELAQAHGVTAAQIAIAFLLSQPFPVFPIVGTHSIDNMRRNLEACEIRLSRSQCLYLESGRME
jgi:aryl-alcohol dehydrogenase-like predicted oxidoreductase